MIDDRTRDTALAALRAQHTGVEQLLAQNQDSLQRAAAHVLQAQQLIEGNLRQLAELDDAIGELENEAPIEVTYAGGLNDDGSPVFGQHEVDE